MANDRIFLYNKITKKYLCIAKRLGGPWYISNVVTKLEDFLNDTENSDSFWECEKCYELRYENDDDIKDGSNFASQWSIF